MSKILFFCKIIDQLEKTLTIFLLIDSLAIKPAVICLPETWLAYDGDTDCYQLPGYQKMITSERKTKGGCVSFLVKINTRWHLISKFSNSHCQALTVRFKLNDINVLVTRFYKKTEYLY